MTAKRGLPLAAVQTSRHNNIPISKNNSRKKNMLPGNFKEADSMSPYTERGFEQKDTLTKKRFANYLR